MTSDALNAFLQPHSNPSFELVSIQPKAVKTGEDTTPLETLATLGGVGTDSPHTSSRQISWSNIEQAVVEDGVVSHRCGSATRKLSKIYVALSSRSHTQSSQRRKPWAAAWNNSGLKFFDPLVVGRVRELGADEAADTGSQGGSISSLNANGSLIACNTKFEFLKRGEAGIRKISGQFWGMKVVSVSPYIGWALPAIRSCVANGLCWRARTARIQHQDLLYHLTDTFWWSQPIQTPPRPRWPLSSTTSFKTWRTLEPNKVRAEIAISSKMKKSVDFGTLQCMVYLNAYINEALRLCPPVLRGSQTQVPRGSVGEVVRSRQSSGFKPEFRVLLRFRMIKGNQCVLSTTTVPPSGGLIVHAQGRREQPGRITVRRGMRELGTWKGYMKNKSWGTLWGGDAQGSLSDDEA
ncbi:hypothetical protein FIBSPDRAFT_901698 [Athelia psychrophila]|uniref:Uncharacterized protein n=1 Tax=Athelia psychrophila TaxID=1759441 RepID=A0A165WSS9_9AGAM|nr:hypothetical protein FIBSPDRAFT_901698 [Fibularhizoctonia sp. CBS 109695]